MIYMMDTMYLPFIGHSYDNSTWHSYLLKFLFILLNIKPYKLLFSIKLLTNVFIQYLRSTMKIAWEYHSEKRKNNSCTHMKAMVFLTTGYRFVIYCASFRCFLDKEKNFFLHNLALLAVTVNEQKRTKLTSGYMN